MQIKNYSIFITLFFISQQTHTMEIQIPPQRKAIVIGASSGIGRALAQELVKKNYLVGVTARRMPLLEDLKQDSPKNIITQFMDMEQLEESRTALTDLLHTMGGADVIVINGATWAQNPEDFTPEKEITSLCEQRMVQVNVASLVALAGVAMAYFKEQGHGHLVGISSVDAMRGAASNPLYCATKSFMATYLEGLRNNCIQNNIAIDVTEVRPGFIKTESNEIDKQPGAYWVATTEEIAPQIVASIESKQKVAYVTRRWRIIGWLLTICPDLIYNEMGGF
jgi:short-subunit dehydrogenase